MSDNKVSVIIPAYNHEQYIGDTVKSVLDQSYEDFELIIINDGSTDATDAQIRKIKDKRIKYISRENRGAHNTINQGIELATGAYISILNSDDIYISDRLEKCVAYIENNIECSVVISEVEGINDSGYAVRSSDSPNIEAWLDWYISSLSLIQNYGMYIGSFGTNILITTSNYFVRKSVFNELGMFRSLRYAHDWDMLLRLAKYKKIHLIQDKLLKYRIHSSNTVHEDDSRLKVCFEVNWLITESLKNASPDIDYFLVCEALRHNHYLDYETLMVLSVMGKACDTESLLDFNNENTLKLIKLLGENL